MAIDNYISTGKCIWCGRTIVNGATFHNIPHVFPHALGGEDTCTDVCDDCNHYYDAKHPARHGDGFIGEAGRQGGR